MDINKDTELYLHKAFFKVLGINTFNPIVSDSGTWVVWTAIIGPNTCISCKFFNGYIYDKYDLPSVMPPIHENCRCNLRPLRAIQAGTATIDGINGADYYIMNFDMLPLNYVTKDEAENMGWISRKGNLRNVIPGATIGGDDYRNDDGKLPIAPGREWYEADINYTGGYRNRHRLLYSNDGLIFVTYNHYETFYEIID